MKRIFNFVLFIILCAPISVYADKINIICPSKVNMGKEFTCQITGESTSSIKEIEATLNLSDGLSLISFNTVDSWQNNTDELNIKLTNDNLVNDKFKIGMLKLKYDGEDSNILEINGITFVTDSDENTSVDNVTKVVNVIKNANGESVSQNSYLSSIIIDNYNLDFREDTHYYTLEIGDSENSLTISPVLNDDSMTFEIEGNENLENGSIININILNQGTMIDSYSIVIQKGSIEPATTGSGSNKYSVFFIVIIVLLVIVNVARIVINKKKNSN